MDKNLILVESTFYFAALLSGIVMFRFLNRFFRLVWLQVCCNIANYIITYGITIYNRIRGTHSTENNHWLFNVYTLLECTLLLLAAMHYFRQKSIRWSLVAGYLVFLAVFGYQLMTRGWNHLANDAVCLEGILLVTIYLRLLYQEFTSAGTAAVRAPYYCISLGTVLYFACIIPYMSMFYQLQQFYPALFSGLYPSIILVLENLRYLLIATGFLLCRRAARSLTPAYHE